MGANSARVVVIGIASMDIRGRTHDPLVPATSNPGTVRITTGGVGRNIAENLARLDVSTTLLTAVGEDAFGEQVLAQTAAAGVDLSHAHRTADYPTATYVAVVDTDGALVVGLDDMGIAGTITPAYISAHRHLIREADMLVLDGNLHPPAIGRAFALARRYEVPVCVDPTSVVLARRFAGYLADCAIMAPNRSEAEVLCRRPIHDLADVTRAAQQLVAVGVQFALITLGADGVVYATPQGSGHVPAIRCQVTDVTGAGDALTAGTVYGLLHDLPVDEAVSLGVSAATLTVCASDTVSRELTVDALYRE
ncbi:MAG: carbohydrate kinase family protein [Chloroflexi bacterium]|nr:carbohydrate kinase family protein [Chloroflexota bacterium]MBU1746969.1 carbohydrate kinase family protein [Chloroflexota bacterium]